LVGKERNGVQKELFSYVVIPYHTFWVSDCIISVWVGSSVYDGAKVWGVLFI